MTIETDRPAPSAIPGLVLAGLIGAWLAVTLVWLVLLAIDAGLDHKFEQGFVTVAACRAAGASFADCTRTGPGVALRNLGSPASVAPGARTPWS